MPYTKKSVTSKRRRPRRSRTTKLKIYRNPNVVPDTKIVKHRYVDTFTLSAGAGLPASRVFRANSIFDPDQTGVGHQPLGTDEWSVFYNHYNVIGSKVTAQFISVAEVGSASACHVGVLLKDNSVVLINPVTIMEQAHSRYGILTSANATQMSSKINGFYSPRKFFGIKDIGDNRTLLGANVGSNPSEDAYFHIYAAPVNSTAAIDAINVIVTIEYLVQYSERKSLLQS